VSAGAGNVRNGRIGTANGRTSAADGRGPSAATNGSTSHDLKTQRQRAIRELVATRPIGSQREVVDALGAQGFEVTQATVSRDISELGLVKAPGTDGHVYVTRESVAGSSVAAAASDERLLRILGDIPVTIGRSGLILVLTGTPGTASVIGQAIDESSLREQEGTLAGDNTLLVLFADASRLERWRARFESIQSRSGGSRIP
jgi:transcriptional regulator of arginine metabolism